MIYAILGRREMGKTTLAYAMAQKVAHRVIFDPRGLIRREGSHRVQHSADLDSVYDAMIEDELAEVVYTPYEDDVQVAFSAFSSMVKTWVISAPNRSLAVLVDEVSFVSLADPTFQWVLRCCGRKVVNVLLTAHRPVDVPTSVRAITDHWLLFQCRQEHDLAVIVERCSAEAAEHVIRLAPRQFAHWDDERAQLSVNSEPASWYVPINDASAPEGEASLVSHLPSRVTRLF